MRRAGPKSLLRAAAVTLALVTGTPAALAVQPDEVLDDPALEARARAISAIIRCPVCQGESIDESNAALARDLRIVLRERLVAGDSDAQAVDYLVARYGEFILFRPEAKGVNLVLWLAGPAMLIVAVAGAGLYLRRRSRLAAAPALSADDEARVAELLRD